MSGIEIETAPRWRSGLAGLVDAALGAGVVWLARDRLRTRPARTALSLLAPGSALVREQLASPGQRLLGTRTVDRRTGRRVELWRTLALLGATAGAELLQRSLQPGDDPVGDEWNRSFAAEMKAIDERYRSDPARRDAEFRRAALEHGPASVVPTIARVAAVGIAISSARRRLRRRLAPTVEVRA